MLSNNKKVVAALLAFLQFGWSFGATEALAQAVVQSGQVHASQAGSAGVPVVAPLNFSNPASLSGNAVIGGSQFTTSGALPSLGSPTPATSLASPVVDAVPGAGVPGVLAPDAVWVSMAEASPVAVLHAAPAETKQAAAVEAASKKVGEALGGLDLFEEAPAESSKGSADSIFAALVGEKLISPTGAVEVGGRASPAPSGKVWATGGAVDVPSPFRRGPAFFKGTPASGTQTARPEVPAAADSAQAKTTLFQRPAVRWTAAAVSAAAFAVSFPWLLANVGLVAAAGSVTLSVIGIPQIIHNFKAGKEGVKDLAIASPLIWFAAAVLLSVVSIGQGSSVWWNVANLAGVLESAMVVGQINWFKRDSKALKATLATAAAVLAPLPLIALQAFMPLKAWVDLAFTGAMGLLWVLNWPQLKQNYKLFKEEGRPPKGIAPLYPALVVAGSALHLFAALAGMDLRWAMNGIIAIVTAGMVLGQIYAPRLANAVVGPLVRLSDRVFSLAGDLRNAWLKRQARSLVGNAFEGRDLSGFKGAAPDAQLAEFVAKARGLPGRSLIYLEAPTAAGKSTLAKQLEGVLAGRIVTFPADRYYKSKADLPLGQDGRPDWDQPESLYIDQAASDIRALLAGEPVELPFHDTVSETFTPKSGEFLRLDGDDVLIVDSVYASHPKLVEAGAGRRSLNVYLTAPASVRFARRLKRDAVERGISVERNLDGWTNVLANEDAHILGLQKHADMVINLITAEELDRLTESYAEILAAEWLKNGRDAAMTRRFLDMVRASLEEDFGAPSAREPSVHAPAAVPAAPQAPGTAFRWSGLPAFEAAAAPLPA
ncbi:MAG: hypothetical protein HY748_18690 [Elusimicrobia bacterium]|nr:hypothetical protein [Elusimicrobiota bacterium]